ncbi:IclR family transcriptional regulator [Desulfosarcina sp.]|uniref:IclR family transcriptional regulator n=1 Tax=Desulfosarcina sp. TaxID=2027861 RepID=UPI0029B7A90B|nr:IclR family transcriptional regulator [Desulfosarcina sp.]MDX2453631.1 IclR family transcriptional regulator [Desulfosarcina sp.]MDX2491338.1 IclR family transcriptional regulator [Desulfosarcina sp.]
MNTDYTVPALKKGLQILELFSVRQRVLTVGEVAERLEVSTSAIYRTIVTLTEMHYLKKAGRNAYELGPMVLSRGFCYLASRDILNTAATRLDELRDETSASCHLAIREGIEAIYIYRAALPQIMMVNVPVGTRFPCHTVSIGRALLCGLSDASLRSHYSGVPLDGYGSGGINSLPQLLVAVAEARRTGISVSGSDFSTAMATPVRDYTGNVVAAINVSVPDFIIETSGVRDHLIACLMNTAGPFRATWDGRMSSNHCQLS